MKGLGSVVGFILLTMCGLSARGAEPEGLTTTTDPLEEVLPVLRDAAGALSSLAVLPVESSGTTEDLSEIQRSLLTIVSNRSDLLIIAPDDVTKITGVEFDISPAALAVVAKKCSAQAVLYPQVIRSKEKLELTLTLIKDDATVLLDRTFTLNALPPSTTRTTAAERSTNAVAPPPMTGVPTAPPLEGPAAEEFARQYLSLAMVETIRPGRIMTSIGPFGVTKYAYPPYVIGQDWFIVHGDGRPISERYLATIVGREDIVKRIDKRVAPLTVVRNVGIGLTLAGFIATGIAAPFVNHDNQSTSNCASAFTITGVVTGLTGLVLWMVYGPQISAIEGPFPPGHTISDDEAQNMVDDYNKALLQKLGTPNPSPPPNQSSFTRDWHFSLGPNARGGIAAALGFRY